MRILVALTYYEPHISGLTNYAKRVAEGLSERGHEVTVLTSRYSQELPPEETRNGVKVVRAPVWARFGKAVLFLNYRHHAQELMNHHDVVVINHPISPPENSALLCAARIVGVPIVAVYQCDLELQRSPMNRLAQYLVEAGGRRLLEAATRIVVLSRGYAETSRFIAPHLAKCTVLPPPVSIHNIEAGEASLWRQRHAPAADVVLGLATRIAAEKGIEHLLAAREGLTKRLGKVQLLIVGEKREALGERNYFRQLRPLLDDWGDRITFLGRLTDRELAVFFHACDVTVLPSVNRTECFGLVQIESMLCGTPVVASDMPGVRDSIARSGAGLLVPPRNSDALAQAIAAIAISRARFAPDPEQIREIFRLDSLADDWTSLLAGCATPRPERKPEEDGLRRLMLLQVREVPPFHAMVRAVESWLIHQHAPVAATVLDLGCGDGIFASLTLPTPIAHGLDPDPASLEHARRSGAYRNLIHGSADRIPLEDTACDLVLANSVLEHIPDLGPVLQEVHRVLSKDGWFVITAPSQHFLKGLGIAVLLDQIGLSALARRYRNWFNLVSRHFHLDSAEDWDKRLGDAGFSMIRHEYYLSSSAMFWFDLMHYISLPCLLARKFLGRWHWFGRPLLTQVWTNLLTSLAKRPPDKEGAYVFILARKK
jgi:glycosyltransferase involved in cell wall biosynthesis/ubiquinone/menaquinone biosynthesis C-methylase UbiE